MTKTVSLADIAKEIDMSPKIARAKARRGVITIKRKAPWVFPTKDKRKVIAALRGNAA